MKKAFHGLPHYFYFKEKKYKRNPYVSPSYPVSLLWVEISSLILYASLPLHSASNISYILLYSQWFLVIVFSAIFSQPSTKKYFMFLFLHSPGMFFWIQGALREKNQQTAEGKGKKRVSLWYKSYNHFM